MRVRAVHLACLLLLLSAFGAAERGSAAQPSFDLGSPAVRVLLQHGCLPREATEAASRATRTRRTPRTPQQPATAPASAHTPAAHTAALHAVTGSGL